MRKPTFKKKPIFRKPNAKKQQVATQRKNLVSLIKSVTLKQSETKYLSKNVVFTNRVANNIYAVRLWGDSTEANNIMPVQGNTDGTRDGDSIVATGYKMRYNFEVAGTFNDCSFKFFFLPYNTDQGDPTDKAQLTHVLSGFLSQDPIQTKRWGGIKYLGKRFLRSTDASTTSNKIISGSFWIPLNKKINFKNDTSNIPTNLKENGIIIWFQSAYNSLGTDSSATSVVNAQVVNTLYYKDP